MTTLAHIDDLHISFGGVAAVSGLSFAVNAGEFLAVIGPMVPARRRHSG